MKRYFLTVFVVGCILLLQVGCQEQTGGAPEPETVVTEPKLPISPVEPEPIPEVGQKGPRITFEKVVHDFGAVGPGTKNVCEFKFTNTGDSLLKIGEIHTCCGVRAWLDKKEGGYVPGESGTVTVRLGLSRQRGSVKKSIFVPANDKTKDGVKLTIKAKVAPKVAYEPKQLKLSLDDEGAGCPEIRVTSLDGQSFAIKSFKATTYGITADYDSSLEATSHVIRPKINAKRLRTHLRGNISIKLTHPGCDTVTIPFEVLSRFKIDPPSIILFDAEPEKAIPKVVWLLNNYGEDFEVESVSSEKGIIKVLSRERVGKRYKFELEITPPADKSKKRFSDVFHINIKGGKKLRVDCSGFYAKE